MGWTLLPDALRPFKIYCSSPSITSQLVLFLWQIIEIGPLGHVRVNLTDKYDYFVLYLTTASSQMFYVLLFSQVLLVHLYFLLLESSPYEMFGNVRIIPNNISETYKLFGIINNIGSTMRNFIVCTVHLI